MKRKVCGRKTMTLLDASFTALVSRTPFAWLRERDVDLLVCSGLHAKAAPRRKIHWLDRAVSPTQSYVSAEGLDLEHESFRPAEGSLIAADAKGIASHGNCESSGRKVGLLQWEEQK
jgi:hypothetical protein